MKNFSQIYDFLADNKISQAEALLQDQDVREFIAYVCDSTSSLGSTKSILAIFDSWKDYHYNDFKSIYKKVSNEIGLINYVTFLGKYLQIDVRDEKCSVSHDQFEYMNSYVGNPSAKFYFLEKFDGSYLRILDLNYNESFNEIRKRLLDQGARKAESKKPEFIKLDDI